MEATTSEGIAWNDSPLPMVGRQQELEHLLSLLGNAISGSGGLVFISGESGIGKTRLTEELVRMAAASGCIVLQGRCVPGIPCPYLPFQEAFTRTGGPNSRIRPREQSEVVIELTGAGKVTLKDPFYTRPAPGAERKAGVDTDRALFQSLDFLVKVSELGPVVLVLEDLHWADSASVQLLHFLARNIKAKRVLMVGTYRPEDLVGPEGENHPLLERMSTMRREGVCEEVALTGLDATNATRLLERYISSPLEPTLAVRVTKDSDGNPLFALETVRSLIDSGSLILKGGLAQLASKQDYGTPTTIKEVINRRLDRLTPDDRRILDCASVMGEDFDPEVVARVLGMDLVMLLERLELIERRFHLVDVGKERCRFAHEKLRRVNYDEISVPRRTELHRRLGEVIEERTPVERYYGDLSTHFFFGREMGKCLKYSYLAADRCIREFAAREAREYYSRALKAAEEGHADRELLDHIIEGLGDSEFEMADHRSAYDHYSRILASTSNSNARARLLRKCCDCWSPQRLGEGGRAKHRELMEEGLRCPEIDPLEKAELLSMMSMELFWDGKVAEALGRLDEALSIYEGEGARERMTWDLGNKGFVLISAGRLDEAIMSLEKAKDILAVEPWPRCELHVFQCLGEAYILKGELDRAWAVLEHSRQLTVMLGNYYELAWVHYYRALIRNFEGDLDASREEALLSKSFASKYDYPFLVTMPNFLLVHLCSRTGDMKEAVSVCQQTTEILSGPRLETHSPIYGLAHLGRGELFAGIGDVARAIEEYERTMVRLKDVQLGPFYTAVARVWYGQALLAKGEVGKALEQLEQARSFFASVGNGLFASRIADMMASGTSR